MRGPTHLLFAFVCFLIYESYYDITYPMLFVSIVLFMALFVDIDEPDSKIGKFFWPLAHSVKWVLGHRGLFHSLIPLLLLFLIFKFVGWNEIAFAIFIGYTSHLVADMITPHGVYLLYPIPWRIRGPIRVGSIGEYMFAGMLLTVIAIKLLL